MSQPFDTGLGLTLVLPDGAQAIEVSSAGPASRQFSLVRGEVISVVRDDGAALEFPDLLAWAQGMAQHYVQDFDAVEEAQGTISSDGKQSYAYAVTFNDANGVPRRATLIATLLAGGLFAGITLLAINAGQGLDTELVQELVDGLARSAG
ncbi:MULTISPECIES: hypothetical protein [Arthrobacter]|uniref:DUF1795 domain-containing protein n=1 Tax=Arthrobacter psychrochitiniphilus TaxID=291045 RepID=A0A2V3DZV9_9MICC|nr:hypothetical protein [Arthrobacter psychrochitiniphilus]NYG18707.1 hypothetical protein [Arthrobacter psychrochitiniphilus]PXA66361.1 hypothetical protein CVS29_06650 [Arthrobacter psychrochitiniphilus]